MGLHLPEMQSPLLLNKPKQVNGAEVTALLSSGSSAQGFLFRRKGLTTVSNWEKCEGNGKEEHFWEQNGGKTFGRQVEYLRR